MRINVTKRNLVEGELINPLHRVSNFKFQMNGVESMTIKKAPREALVKIASFFLTTSAPRIISQNRKVEKEAGNK